MTVLAGKISGPFIVCTYLVHAQSDECVEVGELLFTATPAQAWCPLHLWSGSQALYGR